MHQSIDGYNGSVLYLTLPSQYSESGVLDNERSVGGPAPPLPPPRLSDISPIDESLLLFHFDRQKTLGICFKG